MAARFFSLVAPTFNEGANIGAFIQQITSVLEARMRGNYELIIVDDDSPDLTWQIAARAAQGLPQVKIIRRQNDRGLATAVVCGWQAAKGEWLGVMDADLQHPPEALRRLLDAMEAGADLAIGSRHVEGGGVSTWSLWRRLISRSAQWVGSMVLPAARKTSDPMSGLFVVRRDVLELPALRPLGYKILLEVLVRSRAKRITDVGYVFKERRSGGSKATIGIYGQYLGHLWRLRRTGPTEPDGRIAGGAR